MNAIKFHYEQVLGMPNRFYSMDRPRKRETLPEVLSIQEVKRMIDATRNPGLDSRGSLRDVQTQSPRHFREEGIAMLMETNKNE